KISYLGEKAENERKKESIECSPKNETKIDENKQIEKIDRDNKLPIKEENLNDLAKKDKTIEFLPKSELAQEFHKKPELNGETFKEKKHELFIMDDSLHTCQARFKEQKKRRKNKFLYFFFVLYNF
uniref:Uncharacterized protein n=1 Tax=Meloidogyne incognita TaxID=6306 RepID=A0A914M307_MELIC